MRSHSLPNEGNEKQGAKVALPSGTKRNPLLGITQTIGIMTYTVKLTSIGDHLDILKGKTVATVPNLGSELTKITYLSKASKGGGPAEEELLYGDSPLVERSKMNAEPGGAGATTATTALDSNADVTEVAYVVPGQPLILNVYGVVANGWTIHRITYEPV